ncbi:MAG: TonB-dependent receptor [Bacteroidetes bacterium]|nr:TonB-dependent receptor [Bacteroidota bacterium]
MLYRKYGLFTAMALSCLAGKAQTDHIYKTDSVRARELEEAVVTATRGERRLGNVAVPVTVISQKTIRQSGSLRLNDILAEQAGLFISADYSGTGVQVQGLNPDYTLILIDGEPLVGRNSGVLDLSRITVANIKKIEIVKGPSSSLYGSEALAGVINIITNKPAASSAGASVRYGSFGTSDINLNASWVQHKWNLSGQLNRYGTSGYKLNASSAAQTQDPFHNYTGQLKSVYSFSPATQWTLSTRYFTENIDTKPYSTKDASGVTENVSGTAGTHDININNTLEHRFSRAAKTNLRVYYTDYKSVSDQWYTYTNPASNTSFHDYFQQGFLRLEDQTDISIGSRLALTAGGGWIADKVKSNRYDDKDIVTRDNNVSYLFAQAEWHPFDSWSLTGGLRYDDNRRYQSRLSPKLAIQKKLGSKLRINASIGSGFKAPDFRQLYLNFTNTAPGTGYTVLGNTEVSAGMQRLQQQGMIQSILVDPAGIRPLKPEISTGINVGAAYDFSTALHANINLFRNDIDNLIITGTIAQKTNGMFVYSYFNVNRACTQGLEASLSWQFLPQFRAEAGYQLLYTADKDQLDKIKAGNEFGRDNGVVYRLTTKDYKGLFNRSRHMANLKVYYDHKGWFANIRTSYRSGWGVSDTDGNLYLNRGDKFSNDFIQTNVSAGRTFTNGLYLQAGSDNIFNYRDTQYLPNVPGRTWYATIGFTFTHSNKNKQ